MSDIRPTQMQNCSWPLERRGKGWRRVTMAARYHTGLGNLLRTRQGSFPWAIDYGWILDQLRTQGFTEGDEDVLVAQIQAATSTWLPGLIVDSVALEADPDTEELSIGVYWYLQGTTTTVARAHPEPYKTTVTI